MAQVTQALCPIVDVELKFKCGQKEACNAFIAVSKTDKVNFSVTFYTESEEFVGP